MKRLYSILLYLFPWEYREEYGEELQAVFELSLEEAVKAGREEVARVTLRELLDLPMAILHEHLREGRKARMTGKTASRFDLVPGSLTESFAALAPFLLSMLMVLIGYIGRNWTAPFLWMQIALVILFWASIIGLSLLGFTKGVPRWFLPYLGLPLPIASLVLFTILVEKWGPWWNGLPGLLGDFTQQGLLWSGLILLVLLLVIMTRLVPGFRSFHQRFRDDWTLLSFLLYGAVPLALWITLDGYVNEEPFVILSLLMLALGGWSYLRNNDPLKRFLSLHIGLALSMLTATVGKAVLFMGSWFQVFDSTWKDELAPTVMTWAWLALILLIPLGFNLLPHSDDLPNAV